MQWFMQEVQAGARRFQPYVIRTHSCVYAYMHTHAHAQTYSCVHVRMHTPYIPTRMHTPYIPTRMCKYYTYLYIHVWYVSIYPCA